MEQWPVIVFHYFLISSFRKLGTSIKGYPAKTAVSLVALCGTFGNTYLFAFCFDGIKYPGTCLLLARYLLDHEYI